MRGTIIERGGSHAAKLTIDGAQLWLGSHKEPDHAQAAIDRTVMSPHPSVTVADLVEQFTSRPIVEPESNRHNAYMLAEFTRRYGKRPAASFIRLEAVNWTHNHFATARFVKSLFEHGVKVGVCPDNPFAGLTVTRRAKDKLCPTPAQVEQAARTALALHGGRTGLLLHDMILVSSRTGLRLHELSGLRPEHVEDRDGGVRLHIVGKRGKYRVVPVPGSVAHIIQRRSGSRLLFHHQGRKLSREPQPITRQAIHKLMQPVRTACGLEEMNWHMLRHHYATELANNGVGQTDAAFVMFGHSNPRLLHEVYAHPSRDIAVGRVAAQFA